MSNKIISKSFYNRSTLKVAQELLGCFLVRKFPSPALGEGSGVRYYKIVETEAYIGHKDKASHASRGRTPRNEIMFGEPGNTYIYFTYGMHYMLNIATEKKEYPAAVLIRAVEPICKDAKSCVSTNGPAKLTKALEIDKSFNALPIYTKKYDLWIEDRKEVIKPSQIIKSKRVGIDSAEEYRDKLWRFYIKDNKFISKK